jgi:ribosome biogenesis SPOUT family RNA methylase Rps3
LLSQEAQVVEGAMGDSYPKERDYEYIKKKAEDVLILK